MPEREIRPANGHELHIIEYLMALDAQLNGHQDALRERLKLVPNGWRQWRLITTATRNLLQAVYDTLPDKTLLYIDRLRAQGEVVVRFRPASRTHETVLASQDDLREIINAAMAGECAVCLRDEDAAKRCKLRRAMMDIVPPDDVPRCGCAYRNIAIESEYGKYI